MSQQNWKKLAGLLIAFGTTSKILPQLFHVDIPLLWHIGNALWVFAIICILAWIYQIVMVEE